MQQQTTCFTYEEEQGIVQLIHYVMDPSIKRINSRLDNIQDLLAEICSHLSINPRKRNHSRRCSINENIMRTPQKNTKSTLNVKKLKISSKTLIEQVPLQNKIFGIKNKILQQAQKKMIAFGHSWVNFDDINPLKTISQCFSDFKFSIENMLSIFYFYFYLIAESKITKNQLNAHYTKLVVKILFNEGRNLQCSTQDEQMFVKRMKDCFHQFKKIRENYDTQFIMKIICDELKIGNLFADDVMVQCIRITIFKSMLLCANFWFHQRYFIMTMLYPVLHTYKAALYNEMNICLEGSRRTYLLSQQMVKEFISNKKYKK